MKNVGGGLLLEGVVFNQRIIFFNSSESAQYTYYNQSITLFQY